MCAGVNLYSLRGEYKRLPRQSCKSTIARHPITLQAFTFHRNNVLMPKGKHRQFFRQKGLSADIGSCARRPIGGHTPQLQQGIKSAVPKAPTIGPVVACPRNTVTPKEPTEDVWLNELRERQ